MNGNGNILSTIFSTLGAGIQGQAQAAADAATQAFYVIAGELFVIIALIIAIVLVLTLGAK